VSRYLGSEVGQFRLVSLLEGLSYIVLVGVAVPLKYLAHDPSWVRVLGRVHGALFVLFVLALARAATAAPWTFSRVALAMGSSMVPFGALWFEREMRREEEAPKPG
jgi:integral membrane protein